MHPRIPSSDRRHPGEHPPHRWDGVAALLVAITVLSSLLPVPVSADVLEDLRERLLEKRQSVKNIEERIGKYQKDVAKKKKEAVTLEGQISLIDDSVETLTLEIDKTAIEVEEVQAEIDTIKEEIRIAETNIAQRKLVLREYLRELQVLDSDSIVESLLKYATLSQGLSEVRAIYRVEKDSQETLASIQGLKHTLQDRSESFTDLQRELDVLLTRQKSQKQTLEDQRTAKNRLLEITQAQEAEFKKLLTSSIEQQKQAEAEIARIDAEIRAELERQGIKKLGGVGAFEWPITAIFGISCGFHCPDYPYRNLIGPHTGIDIPTPMGTEIHVPADGYVARNSVASGAGYSYILIIHGDNLSTVYGHIASTAAAEGSFVTRGQTIGYSGGVPGTRGAGLSTGPHLHFEVRKNGIPVNPIPYLP